MEVQRADVSRIQGEHKEQQAFLQEAEATEQQLRTEVMLVQHTINVTNAILQDSQLNTSFVRSGELDSQHSQRDMHLLSNLVESRQQILVSLQGELENLLPVRSHLQVRVAELRRQMNDRKGSVDAVSRFSGAIRDVCSGSLARADEQAEARSSQARHISSALQALERIGSARAKTSPAVLLQIDAGGGPVPEDDLLDVFGSEEESEQHHAAPEAESRQAPEADQESFVLKSEEESPVRENNIGNGQTESRQAPDVKDQASLTRASLEASQTREMVTPALTLLAGLRAAKGTAGKAQREWCIKERAHSELLLEVEKNSLDRVRAEVAAHTNAEAQLTDAVASVRQMDSSTKAAAAETAACAQRELDFISRHLKDQGLATKILKQTVTVLSSLDDTGRSDNTKPRATAIRELSRAQNDFQTQITSSGLARSAVDLQAKTVAARASEAARAFRREEGSIELARDAHMTERLRLADSNEAREAETKEAAAFLQELAAGCAKDSAGAAEKQRQAEVRALEDAQRVTEGKSIGQTQSNLRGVHDLRRQRGRTNLTPIERAALTMGVDVDDP
jgi:hypothetical protein